MYKICGFSKTLDLINWTDFESTVVCSSLRCDTKVCRTPLKLLYWRFACSIDGTDMWQHFHQFLAKTDFFSNFVETTKLSRHHCFGLRMQKCSQEACLVHNDHSVKPRLHQIVCFPMIYTDMRARFSCFRKNPTFFSHFADTTNLASGTMPRYRSKGSKLAFRVCAHMCTYTKPLYHNTAIRVVWTSFDQ